VFYAAYVLILVLGLRKGELLGLTWELIDLDAGELYVGGQLQRVGRQLLRRETKTEISEAPLPLPDLCVTALTLRKQHQDADHDQADDAWLGNGLVFTTRYGTPIEPRNFSRSFDRRIIKAGVPGSQCTVHARPADHCSPRLMFILVSPCRSFGTARLASRWRSTPRYHQPPPAMRLSGSGPELGHLGQFRRGGTG